MDPGLYLPIQLVAYGLWCYLGLRFFRPQPRASIGEALGFGIIRLFLGLFFGLVIFFLAAFWGHIFRTGLPQNILTYLGAYVPVRGIEWTILVALLTPGCSARRVGSSAIAMATASGGSAGWLSPIFPSSRRLMVPFPRADSCVERSAFLAPFRRFSVQ